MHPDDEREYMDEISGFTRWDDMNERYGSSAVDYPEFEEPKMTLRQAIRSRLWWWGYKLRNWWKGLRENEVPF